MWNAFHFTIMQQVGCREVNACLEEDTNKCKDCGAFYALHIAIMHLLHLQTCFRRPNFSRHK